MLKTIAKKSRISVLLRLRRNFVMGKLVRKQGIQKHAALRRVHRTFDVLTLRSVVETIIKLSPFWHSDVFIAFGSFLLIWTTT